MKRFLSCRNFCEQNTSSSIPDVFPKSCLFRIISSVLAHIPNKILRENKCFPTVCLCSQIPGIPEGFSTVLKFTGFHVTVLARVCVLEGKRDKRRLSHRADIYEVSPVCVLTGTCRCVWSQEATLLIQSFTALCVFEWRLKCSHFWKVCPHSLKSWCLSPVCVHVCVSRCDGHLRALPHCGHS